MKNTHKCLLLGVLVLAFAPAAAVGAGGTEAFASPDLVAWHQGLTEFRERREGRLADPAGWLTLVGLEWLGDGRSTVGASEENDIVLPGGPERWGIVEVRDDGVWFEPQSGAPVTIDGETAQTQRLTADTEGNPTVVASGTLSFIAIDRQAWLLRIKDSEARTRVAFDGLDYFETSPKWLIDGAFERAPEGTTIPIANVLDQLTDSSVYGTFHFEMDGKEHSLIALGDEDSASLWFLFADRTNSTETYGAGRFLYSEGLPVGGRLVVDFNKSYNPPCAFNDYSTCPLPPPENRLDLRVTAGEKDFKKPQ